jgi:hypothetical protein
MNCPTNSSDLKKGKAKGFNWDAENDIRMSVGRR